MQKNDSNKATASGELSAGKRERNPTCKGNLYLGPRVNSTGIGPLPFKFKVDAYQERLKKYKVLLSSASIYNKAKLNLIITIVLAPSFFNVENRNLNNNLIAKLNSLSRSIKR
eukprot:snap_masked-scaffold_1-processed-gene-19.41-mRNA-1 protein AED:1.00 eAED:1.00 QI:0/-1/0/0/-1/1/1/0/112